MRLLGHPPAIFCMTPLMQAKGSTPFRLQVSLQVSMMEVIAAARSPPAVEPVKSQVRRKMATPRSARSAIGLSISRRPSSQYLYKSGFDPTVNVRLRHSFNGEHYRRGGLDVVKDTSFARADAAGAIARSLRRAFFRTPYGILDNIDPLAKLAAKR
jgi:hypothetical protein